MVTRNWYNSFKGNNGCGTIPDGLKTIDGVTRNAARSTSSNIGDVAFYASSVVFDNSTNGIVLGSGTTPATVDDYKLESQIRSGLACSLVTTGDDDNNAVYTITATNTTSEDIVIGEVGIYARGFYASGNSSVLILTERTVLEAPITIEPGGVGQVTYSIKLPYPS